MHHPTLTIIIPTFNERDNIAPLVKEVSQALAGIDWAIFFFDDNSNDGSSEYLFSQTKTFDFTLHKLCENLGSAYSRNLALSLLSREYFIFVDSDDQIRLNSLELALQHSIESGADLNKFPYILMEEKSKKLVSYGTDIHNSISEIIVTRDKMLRGLGYWRFIYKSEPVKSASIFFPTFSLAGGFFILDDFFWLIGLISSKKLIFRIIIL